MNFVPGPVVDDILAASNDSAAENVYRTILADVGTGFRTNKASQEKAREHARNLVQAVREAYLSVGRNGNSTIQHNDSASTRERILKFLHDKEQLFSPLEIADRAHLNRNTVRRELQELLREGRIIRLAHKYRRKSTALEKDLVQVNNFSEV